jgi:GGDEF domain-containing protein
VTEADGIAGRHCSTAHALRAEFARASLSAQSLIPDPSVDLDHFKAMQYGVHIEHRVGDVVLQMVATAFHPPVLRDVKAIYRFRWRRDGRPVTYATSVPRWS